MTHGTISDMVVLGHVAIVMTNKLSALWCKTHFHFIYGPYKSIVGFVSNIDLRAGTFNPNGLSSKLASFKINND
jgi:hypothetical protein